MVPLSSSGSGGSIGCANCKGRESLCGVATGRQDLLDQRFLRERHTIGLSICRKPLFIREYTQSKTFVPLGRDLVAFLFMPRQKNLWATSGSGSLPSAWYSAVSVTWKVRKP